MKVGDPRHLLGTPAVTIHVRWLDEKGNLTDWEPVAVNPQTAGSYLVIGPTPDRSTWEYPAGSFVRCEPLRLGARTCSRRLSGVRSHRRSRHETRPRLPLWDKELYEIRP
jgi:hypothetical protein